MLFTVPFDFVLRAQSKKKKKSLMLTFSYLFIGWLCIFLLLWDKIIYFRKLRS